MRVALAGCVVAVCARLSLVVWSRWSDLCRLLAPQLGFFVGAILRKMLLCITTINEHGATQIINSIYALVSVINMDNYISEDETVRTCYVLCTAHLHLGCFKALSLCTCLIPKLLFTLTLTHSHNHYHYHLLLWWDQRNSRPQDLFSCWFSDSLSVQCLLSLFDAVQTVFNASSYRAYGQGCHYRLTAHIWLCCRMQSWAWYTTTSISYVALLTKIHTRLPRAPLRTPENTENICIYR